LVPAHFGDPLLEYNAVRTGVGLLDLFARSVLRFSGGDRVSFLNGMVSNDVRTLSPGRGLHAAFLDIQGKILADARIFCMEESLLVDIPEPCRKRIIEHLERHLVADEVEIQDVSADHLIVSLRGPSSGKLIKDLASIETLPRSDLDHIEAPIGKSELHLIRVTHICQQGYDLIVPRAGSLDVIRWIMEVGKKFALSWVGTEAQEMLRIEAAIPRYGTDMTSDHLLLEVGLNDAVSFTKGCYLGQEVVERIHSRGHVNKRLVLMILETPEPLRSRPEIHHGTATVGKVTSSAFSPRRNTALALGYVQQSIAEPGTQVTITETQREIPAVISSPADQALTQRT
jgi:folate-binding protein YgfZ